MMENRKVYRILVGNPERKKLPGRSRSSWVDNIQMDLVEIGWGRLGWIGLAQDRYKWRALVTAATNIRVP
jgi:hypothetical protein